ncbi:PREDICTED: kinesin-like protein Nod isoform X2 [Drosophila arizonae]|uniref:Kinesin-like protein n=1 Tax=Drosophila arizonae TaxID=7263 RepID=A0ABM1PUH6_DROAR|nr:PREDICTED: kinesin-like protein Nod isoform X2 [Drosophila arizonae]
MNINMKESVVVAVREAPYRNTGMQGINDIERSVLEFSRECPKAVIVDGTVYSFDHSFDSKVSQEQLYRTLIHPLVLKALAGYDCTAMAYGQTGTGKSYSMGMSAERMSEEHVGIVPRCLKDILKYMNINDQKENHAAMGEVFASFIEVYNEKAYDLLAVDVNEPLTSRTHPRFTGGTCMPMKSQKDLLQILMLGTKNRHVRATNMNNNSSRSHAIVTIHIQQGFQHSRLNIIDLAGSESVRRTGNEGVARAEGVFINMGLMGINKVMASLSAGRSLIPYPSLNSQCSLTLLVCISPHASDLNETLSTIRFAKNAKQMKITPQLSQQIQQMQEMHQNRSSAQTTSNQSITQNLGRLLPNSVNIRRRPPLSSNPGARNSFSISIPPGAQPNSRKRARRAQNALLSSSDESDTGVAPTGVISPTVAEFLKLKKEYAELQRGLRELREQRAQPEVQAEEPPLAAERPQPSQLTFREFNSDLSSIAEEGDAIPPPPFRIFTSSPTIYNNQNAGLLRMSGVSSAPTASSSGAAVAAAEPMPGRLSTRLNSRQAQLIQDITNGQDQRPLRRSSRIASQSGGPPTERNEPAERTEGNERAEGPSQLRATSALAAIGERFTMDSTVGSQRARLSKHRAELLSLLNTASVKDLQALPQIGPKTAMALIMQRSVLGHFRNWKQVEKLPIWKDISWSRFAKAVCIEIDP